jgi:hypothetical protein
MIYEKFDKLDDEQHGRIIKSVIGMDRSKFNKLAEAFASAYDAIQQERLLNGEIKQVPSGGPKGYLDTPEKKLFCVLYDLKTYPTFDVLGFHFGFSSGHAHGHVDALLPVLLRSLSDLGVLPLRTPGTPEEFAHLIEQYGDIALDGLECACVRPQDKELQEDRYSGKKTPPAQGARPHDPAPTNPFPVLLRRRKRPRLRPYEKGLRPPVEMVPQSESVARSRLPRGGNGLRRKIHYTPAAQKA